MTNGSIQLRPVGVADAEIIFRSWGRHPQNFAYLTARVFAELSDAQRYIQNLFPTKESRAFHIVDSTAGEIGIVKAAVFEHRAQIGYVVHQPFWGKGIATAAVRQVTELLEDTPHILRLWATCAIENPASARVLERCGFQREAVLRNWVVYPAQGDRAFDNYSYVKIPRHAG